MYSQTPCSNACGGIDQARRSELPRLDPEKLTSFRQISLGHLMHANVPKALFLAFTSLGLLLVSRFRYADTPQIHEKLAAFVLNQPEIPSFDVRGKEETVVLQGGWSPYFQEFQENDQKEDIITRLPDEKSFLPRPVPILQTLAQVSPHASILLFPQPNFTFLSSSIYAVGRAAMIAFDCLQASTMCKVPNMTFYKHPTSLVSITNTFVDSYGGTYSNDFAFVPKGTCNDYVAPTSMRKSHLWNSTTIVTNTDRLFISSQTWGESVYHVLMENVMRLIPFIPMLNENLGIKIHYAGSPLFCPMLDVLGLKNCLERVVANVTFTKIAYIPTPMLCGEATHYNVQRARTIIQSRIPRTDAYIVIVKRTRKRMLLNHDEVVSDVESTFPFIPLKVYDDSKELKALTTLEVFTLFRNALIVIAPHGAALSNMVAMDSGTTVIEVIQQPPGTNKLYSILALQLGIDYYGLMSATQSTLEGKWAISLDNEGREAVVKAVGSSLKKSFSVK